MKKSKVHLVPNALIKNMNQNHFYTDRYAEFLEQQTSVNHNLMNSVTQLDQSCKTILSDLRDQNLALNKLNNNHKYDYVNLKKILFNLAQTTRGYGSHLQKQEYTIQAINEHLDNQSKFNDLATIRATNHDKVLKQLQGSLNRQRNFLNNFAIKQNNSFDNITHQLSHQDEANIQLQNQLDTQKEFIQNVLEEQKRLFTIVSNISEEQNHIHENKEFFNKLQSQLDHQNESFKLLNKQFDRQKELINELSDNQNSQFELVFKQLIEQFHFHKQSLEKQQLSEEMDEFVLEEINLQIIQQDDIYNYLQDSLNRQQGFLLQLSDNQNRQFEKVKKSLENIIEIDAQQVEALSGVKESIEKLLGVKGNLGILLSKLPPDYPIKQIVVGGVSVTVEKLIIVNQKTGIATFAKGTQTISFDIEKIEAIHWD